MGITPGNWQLGRHIDTVVSGHIKDTDRNHIESYGGQVIAESILNEKDRHLISAAPELFEALTEALKFQDDEIHHPDVWDMARNALKKAKGEIKDV